MNLSKQQQQAVEDESNNICVIAGAGSGKTRTLCAKINHLVSLGVDPKSICCITFTTSAAKTIRERTNKDIGFIGTLHSYMFSILVKNNNELVLFPEEEVANVLKKYAGKLNFKTKSTKKLLELRRNWWKVQDGHEFSRAESQLAQQYSMHLRSMGCVDYDGILEYGLSFVREYAMCGEIKHLLVDEFQDSADIDIAIYESLNVDSRFYVGDPRQAIYGFRGGNKENLNKYAKSDFSVHYLTDNYRSSEKICSIANNIHKDEKPMNAFFEFDDNSVYICGMEDSADELHFITNFLLRPEWQKDSAILCRTNFYAKKVKEYLKSRGINVQETKSLIDRSDFWKIDYLINLKSNPNSRTAAELYLRRLHPNKPDGFYLEQLNSGIFNVNHSPDQPLSSFLSANGLSTETIMLLNPIIESIDYIEDPKELSLAIKSAMTQVGKDEDAIYVGTIHSSKSMEWNNVFIPFCNEGILPLASAPMEDERNLMYVACTRAKHNIVFSWSKLIESPNPFSVDLQQGEISNFIKNEKIEKVSKIEHFHESL